MTHSKALFSLAACSLSLLAVAQPASSSGPASAASSACSQLKSKFPGKVVDQSTGNYTAEEDVNWSTSCWLPAQCFFKPSSTQDVADGLAIVVKAGSKFAVRNGGHNPNPGYASIDGSGVLFDVADMTSLTISPDHSVMYAGTGNKGGDIQKFADSYGLSGVTGVNTMVGISGLTLGGGFPIISSNTGLVCDNIRNFEVVLGNSTIVNANATSHQDLYQALRGGGNNFGIVTRFDMLTSQTHNIWYTIFTVNPSDYKTFMPAIAKAQQNMESDKKAGIYVTAAASEVEIALFYASPADNPAALQPLLSLPKNQTLVPPTNGTVYKLAQAMSSPEPDASRNSTSFITKPNADYYVALYEQLQKAPNSGSAGELVLAIKPINSNVAGLGTTSKTGGVPNSLNVQAEPQTWISALAQWSNPGDNAKFGAGLDSLTQYARTQAQNDKILLPNLFANDAGASQNVLASYGSQSLANLKAVSTKYDPQQVFQKLQNGAWFVSKA